MRSIARSFLWAVAATLVGGTVGSHVRTSKWWVRYFDYPRPQLALLSVIVAAALRRVEPNRRAARRGELALIATCAWQGWQMKAYTPLARKQTQPSRKATGDTISLLISNVYMHNRQADRLAAHIREHRPDIVILLEPDRWWIDALAGSIAVDLPHQVLHPLDNSYGIALYSRLELVEPGVDFLVEPDVPSIRTRVRLPSGQLMRVYAIHPRPPQPGVDTDERDAELVVVGRRAVRDVGPVIVAGDLNDVAWSHTTRLFQRISSMLDPRVGRGFYNTFPAHLPLLRFPIDQVFHTPDFSLDDLRVLPSIGSDHFPVYVRLRYDPTLRRSQPAPQPALHDLHEANEIVAEARERQ